MRRILFSMIMVCMIVMTPSFAVATADTADELLSQMTLEEKVKFVVGMGMRFPGMPSTSDPTVGQTQDRVPGAAGTTFAIARLNIPHKCTEKSIARGVTGHETIFRKSVVKFPQCIVFFADFFVIRLGSKLAAESHSQ